MSDQDKAQTAKEYLKSKGKDDILLSTEYPSGVLGKIEEVWLSDVLDDFGNWKEMELKDTINCWVATRINGASAGMGCSGVINVDLLKILDEEIRPKING